MLKEIRSTIKKASAHQGLRKYLANTAWMFSEQVLRIITGLLVGIYVARYLGPEKFGLFSYSIAFISLFSAISKVGLDGIVVRDLVNAPEKRDAYLGTAFWIKGFGVLIACFGIVEVVTIANFDPLTKLYIFIIAAGLTFQPYEVIDFYFQSRVLSKYVSMCKMTQLFLSSVLKLYFVYTNKDLIWFVAVSTIDQASLGLALIFAYSQQKNKSFYFKFDRQVAKKLLRSAKPLIVSGVMVSLYSSMDRIIIKEFLGTHQVGLYAAATGLTIPMYFVPYLLANSFFPAILSAKQQSQDLYNRRLSTLYKLVILMGLFVGFFVSTFAIQIIDILYGEQYEASAETLKIYIWNFLLICFSAIFGKWLLSENLQRLIPRFTTLAIIINIIGCLLLIPRWSIEGAAIAAVAAQLLPVLLFGIINKHVRSNLILIFKRF
ncbi:MAG: flippase [Methylotenera sp.]|nr:flippase [Methylotenera sp.]